MNINITIIICFIILAFGIFAASVIHFENYEPYEFLKITNSNGEDHLIRIHKLNSNVDSFNPTDLGYTNFNWVRLNN